MCHGRPLPAESTTIKCNVDWTLRGAGCAEEGPPDVYAPHSSVRRAFLGGMNDLWPVNPEAGGQGGLLFRSLPSVEQQQC